MKCEYNYQPFFDESLFSKVIDFFQTYEHPKFVYKLDINNYKTVSNEIDMIIVVLVQASNECIMYVSCIYHECVRNVS